MDFKGKCAIVTGSSSGVGAATALELARRGASVLINCSKSTGPAEAVAAQCREAGADAFVVSANVADDADCVRLAAAGAQSETARVLLVAGRPLHEPIAQHGPFVMNTTLELRQAVADFQSGALAS